MNEKTCKGSIALGTGCRRCSKCKAELAKLQFVSPGVGQVKVYYDDQPHEVAERFITVLEKLGFVVEEDGGDDCLTYKITKA